MQCAFVELNQLITYVNDVPPPDIIASQCKEKALGKARKIKVWIARVQTQVQNTNIEMSCRKMKSCMIFNRNICILIFDLTLFIHVKHKFHLILTKMLES